MKFDLNGVEFVLPDGWRGVEFTAIAPPTEGAGPTPALAMSSGFRPTVKVVAEVVPEGTTAKGYFDAQVQAMREAGMDLRVIKAGPYRKEGCDGLWADLGSKSPDGTALRQLQHILVRGTEVWITVGTAQDDDGWPAAKTGFEQLTSSMAFV